MLRRGMGEGCAANGRGEPGESGCWDSAGVREEAMPESAHAGGVERGDMGHSLGSIGLAHVTNFVRFWVVGDITLGISICYRMSPLFQATARTSFEDRSVSGRK